MRKGFAPLVIIGIIAVASLVVATSALSALKERPNSGMYGLQRLAEGSPLNLARYFSKNYTAELLEKRENETHAVLRSEGKDAALAFAKKEGTLTGGLEYEIASYVPLIGRVVRSMETVLRLTTPERAPLGKDAILAPNTTVRFGEEIVLEIGGNPREIVKSDRRGGYVRWEYMNDSAGFDGIRAEKAGGSLVAYDFNKTRAIAREGDNVCSKRLGLCALSEEGMLKIGVPQDALRVEAYFIKNGSVIGYGRPASGDVLAGYLIEYENVSEETFRVRVSAKEPKGTEFIKVCGYSDYAENGTACGAGLRALNISVSSNGKPVGGIYYLRIEKDARNVCLSDECIRVGGTKLLNNSLIALFSTDGRDWKNRSAFTRELDVEAYDVFNWNFENYTDRIVALLPDGNYSFMVDLDPCAGCRYGAEAQVILEADAGQGSARIDYSARQEYVGDLNFHVNVYGGGRYGDEVDAIRDAYRRFANLTGRVPEGIKVFNIRSDFAPFSYMMLSKIKSGQATAYYVPEGYSREDNRIEILPGGAGSICHELAHALYFENFKGSLGSEFEEGFAISVCGIEKGATSFEDCMPGRVRERGIYTPHAVGRCVFEALDSKGYITDGFWRRLLDFPCYVLLDADLETEEGRNIWYYVLSKAAGRPVSGFPHTGEKDYCGIAAAKAPGECAADAECRGKVCYGGKCVEPKLTLAFLPVNWKGTMEDFSAAVDERVELLLNALPLRDCKGRLKVIKGAEPCRVASYESAGLEKIRECASLVRSDYIIGLTDSTEAFLGVAEGIAIPGMRATLVTTERVFTTAHEIGHAFGLKDEYCNFQVGGIGKCGFGVGPNPLKSEEGCREEDSPYDKDGYPDCCVSGGYADACSGNVGLSESAVAEQAYARGVYDAIDGILGNKSYLENNRESCAAARKGIEDALTGLERGITGLGALQKEIGFTPGPVWPALQEFKNHSALCRESADLCGCVNGIDFVLSLNDIKYGLKTRFYLDDFVRFNSRNIMVNDHGAKNGSFEFSKPAYDYLGTLPGMRCD